MPVPQGGHPLAIEYVDRLLARGGRSPELASRLEGAITTALRTARERAGTLPGTALPRTEPTELPETAAELIAATAGHVHGARPARPPAGEPARARPGRE